MPKETPEQSRMLLDFPFADLDKHLEQNYDPTHQVAKAIIGSVQQCDPVLFKAMCEWRDEHDKEWGLRASSGFAFSGTILCYEYLKKKAEERGEALPSFTTLGKKPEHGIKNIGEHEKIAQEMSEKDPDLVQQLGGIIFVLRAMEWETYRGNNDPIEPHGAFVTEGALKCYAAFRNLTAGS